MRRTTLRLLPYVLALPILLQLAACGRSTLIGDYGEPPADGPITNDDGGSPPPPDLTMGGPIDVSQRGLVRLDVSPPAVMMAINTQTQLRATGFFNDGSSADLTFNAAWSSSDPMVANVKAGNVFAFSSGKALITAT